jgi:hypothetical protein
MPPQPGDCAALRGTGTCGALVQRGNQCAPQAQNCFLLRSEY